MHASMSTVVPKPDPEIEQQAKKANAVREYTLSAEELAHYRSLPIPKPIRAYAPRRAKTPLVMTSEEQSRRANLRYQKEAEKQINQPIKFEEEVTVTTNPISREEYLIRRRNGEKRTVIMDDLGLNTTQAYKLLTEWGIKDMKIEQKFIDLISGRGVQPRGLGAINETHKKEMATIDPPVKKVEEPATTVQEKMVKHDPEPTLISTPESDPVVEESVHEPVRTNAELVTKKPLYVYDTPAPKQYTRSITIKTDGHQTEVEEELLAILRYVQAMKGRNFQLELYLGEVKVG